MLKNKKISLSQFEVFLVVANSLSFTLAANILGVSRASISQSIKALEKELEVPLFLRTTRSISLTSEGESLFEQCSRLRYELDNARALIKSFHKKPKGKLKISCNPFLAEKVLLPILMQYKEQFPDVELIIVVEERIPDFDKEQTDIAFGVNWKAPDDLIARKIGETRYVLCASPRYLKKYGVPKNLEDLKKHNFIPHISRHTSLVGLKDANSYINISSDISSNNVSFIKKCVLDGLGIAQFHEYAAIEEIKRGDLIEVLPAVFNEKESLFIYYQKNRFVQPKIKELVKIILERVQI
ncbi:LysR family transcriptional regulator [Pseudofrancisella aestuarii]|uniref:LysR family transcriptional regulator n=1 Tax=Pseudofrancisella aestuarii TaxID=2670347 RepID=A0ABV9TAZ5_9GAMM|nr:LysR family transcriptional regulator [Pseudofrancisella aestuarii]